MKRRANREELMDYLRYGASTGKFYWKKVRVWRLKPGDQAGCSKGYQGYSRVSFGGIKYPLHRLAWLFEYGYWPERIDHIDGNKNNNRIENLREATRSLNTHNFVSKTNGAYIDKRGGRWYSTFVFNGEQIYLGRFNSKREAQLAFRKESIKRYGKDSPYLKGVRI